MFLSVFDLFKVGLGPSSSHTSGPMVAANMFLQEIASGNWPRPQGATITHLKAHLHGSLAFTGKGHASDNAVVLGLSGYLPETIEPSEIQQILDNTKKLGAITVKGHGSFKFIFDEDLVFDFGPSLPLHPNGLTFEGFDESGKLLLKRVYFSVGGGFVKTEDELNADLNKMQDDQQGLDEATDVPFPFRNAQEMLAMGKASGLSIADMKKENEIAYKSPAALDEGLENIWRSMVECMERGLVKTGKLPGGLNVERRAQQIHQQLLDETGSNSLQPHKFMDWLGVYAMAVNEENASGGKIVTAPTNGAAGVVPAVIRYYLDHCIGATDEGVKNFLLVAGAIGGIIKSNASISGAEVGCQGEVGSASSMAAAGLCAVLGGTNAQIENAAEIALEHHLGMTCDPIAGLVQVPCIERNAVGAVKAVTAASLALRGNGTHLVPLDNCIETMRQTGKDMMEEYKETSKGGLAVNLVAC